jgi:UDP-2,4-diacetamido-2,4,6-trideoxy-beta-L-altropyranose hydrolase
MNLPFIAIEVAENQKELVKYLKSKHIPVLRIRELRKINDFIFNK